MGKRPAPPARSAPAAEDESDPFVKLFYQCYERGMWDTILHLGLSPEPGQSRGLSGNPNPMRRPSEYLSFDEFGIARDYLIMRDDPRWRRFLVAHMREQGMRRVLDLLGIPRQPDPSENASQPESCAVR